MNYRPEYWNESICIPNGDNEIEIDVKIKFIWENDGIGPYEYWGFKCFDKGNDYVLIEDIQPVFKDEDEATRKIVQDYIDMNEESLAERFSETIADDYEPNYPEPDND